MNQFDFENSPSDSWKTSTVVALAHALLILFVTFSITHKEIEKPKRLLVRTVSLQPHETSSNEEPTHELMIAAVEPVSVAAKSSVIEPEIIEPTIREPEITEPQITEPEPRKEEKVEEVVVAFEETAPAPPAPKIEEMMPPPKPEPKRESKPKPKPQPKPQPKVKPKTKTPVKPEKKTPPPSKTKVTPKPKVKAKALPQQKKAPPKKAVEKPQKNASQNLQELAAKKAQLQKQEQEQERAQQHEQEQKRKNALIADALSSLNDSGKASSQKKSLNEKGSSSTSKGPSRIDSLASDSYVSIHSDGSSLTKEERSYESELASRLKLTLHLPEYGDVKVKLTLSKQGKVLKVVVKSSKSLRNKEYVQKTLPGISFPRFGTNFKGHEEYSFDLSLSNDLNY